MHRSPTPDRDSLLERRKRRFDEEDDRPIHRGSRQETLSRSPPPSRKKSRLEHYKTLPLRPRTAASPPPLSADAARLSSILKEDSGGRLPLSMTSSAPKWKERGKLPSGAMREQDQYQGSPERQYRPQSNAPATFPARIRPSVSSEFNLSFSISAEKLRTRYLPSAIEVSERGSDSAYYVHEKKTTKTGKAALTTNDLDDTISKTDTGSFVPNVNPARTVIVHDIMTYREEVVGVVHSPVQSDGIEATPQIPIFIPTAKEEFNRISSIA
ncbi:hypothetical protein XANCAGTX0491_002164 [Xanthoria calcicola]